MGGGGISLRTQNDIPEPVSHFDPRLEIYSNKKHDWRFLYNTVPLPTIKWCYSNAATS